MLETTAVRDFLSCTDILVLLVTALCHDLDHDGHTNSYHINAGSDLAQRYNDCSVMENHHCAIAFAILRHKDCNILEDLPQVGCQAWLCLLGRWARMRSLEPASAGCMSCAFYNTVDCLFSSSIAAWSW
jgi:hypothetical protein